MRKNSDSSSRKTNYGTHIKGFTSNRKALSEWLDAEDFNELETTVVGTYEKAHVKAKTVNRR